MAPPVAPLTLSVSLTALLGFGLPALLGAATTLLGLPETSVTECIVALYLLLLLCVATPRLPRGVLEVTGRGVLVTGCDSGFGHALALHLHHLGFTVFAGCLLKDQGGAGAKKLEDCRSSRMKVLQLDVRSDQQVVHAVDFIRGHLGEAQRGLWALVNNAGVSASGEVEFTSLETYKRVSEVNLWGTVRVTKAALPLIRRAKGRVVNMSSSDARMGDVMRSPDCVSKYGVEAFSDCLRHEMKPWGVKVSLVEPGNFTAAAGLLTRHAAPDKLWAEAPAGVREDYGRVHFQRRAAPVRSFRSGGRTDVGPVVQDVVDAIRSKRPYTRYNPMEPRCWLRMQLMTHLPAALSDLLYF